MKLFRTRINVLKAKRLDSIRDVLGLDILSPKVWLAGGALRTLIDHDDIINDYDLFFQNAESLIAVKSKLLTAGFDCIYECPNGYLFTYRKNSVKIQLICEKTYQNIEELLDSFDFTATCAATDGEFVYYSSAFVKDVKKKELRLANLVYPVATLKRIVKYAARGYTIRKVTVEFVKQVTEKHVPYSEEEMREYID